MTTIKKRSRPSRWEVAARNLEGRVERASGAMAYLSGGAFLLLAIFLTVNSLLRYSGLPFFTASDDVSVLILGFASTWAMAFALAKNAHVQIDVLLPLFSKSVRRSLMSISLVCTTVVAAMFAFQSWLLSFDSYELGITSVSMLRFPLFIPQAVVAAGLTLLTLQAALMSLIQLRSNRIEEVDPTQTSAV